MRGSKKLWVGRTCWLARKVRLRPQAKISKMKVNKKNRKVLQVNFEKMTPREDICTSKVA